MFNFMLKYVSDRTSIIIAWAVAGFLLAKLMLTIKNALA
jgi:hypothetical protein